MTLDDLDEEVRWLYKLAKADQMAPPGPIALARGLLMKVVWGCSGVPALFDLDTHTIRIRRRLSRVERNFLVSHELGEYWFTRLGVRQGEREQLCDALGVRILSPTPAFRHAAQRLEFDIPALADVFGMSETCVVLRIGEVFDCAVAVVMPHGVRVRGPWHWGQTESEVRELADAEVLPRGLRRVVLTDDRRRVALLSD